MTADTPDTTDTAGLPRALRRVPLWWWVAIGVLVAVTTLLHYATSPDNPVSHGVFRRLYYLPIVWAALAAGLRGGLAIAVIAAVAYAPHAFLMMDHHSDPAPAVDKAIEIALYFGVGALAGLLVDRERRAQAIVALAALERARAAADAARLESLVHLTRGLAHEIRNPLGSIEGAIEILAAAVPGGESQREMADIALCESARLNRVLTEFLAFASPRAPELRPFPSGATGRHVTTLLGPNAAQRAVTLRMAPELAATELPLALGDADQITQVLMNLVRNALDATPAGGWVEVAASAARGDDGTPVVTVEVRDSGVGIAPELAGSVFDPYVTTKEGGTGLGLAIASRFVGRHGQTLRHRPRQGGGTIFSFALAATPEAPR